MYLAEFAEKDNTLFDLKQELFFVFSVNSSDRREREREIYLKVNF